MVFKLKKNSHYLYFRADQLVNFKELQIINQELFDIYLNEILTNYTSLANLKKLGLTELSYELPEGNYRSCSSVGYPWLSIDESGEKVLAHSYCFLNSTEDATDSEFNDDIYDNLYSRWRVISKKKDNYSVPFTLPSTLNLADSLNKGFFESPFKLLPVYDSSLNRCLMVLDRFWGYKLSVSVRKLMRVWLPDPELSLKNPVISHKDNNYRNCHKDNLYWLSKSELKLKSLSQPNKKIVKYNSLKRKN